MHQEVGMTHMLPTLCMNSSAPEFLTITIWLPTQPFLDELHSSNEKYYPLSSEVLTPFSQMYWTKLEILLVTKARTCPSADFRWIVLDCQGCLLSLWHLNIDWSKDVQKFCILC